MNRHTHSDARINAYSDSAFVKSCDRAFARLEQTLDRLPMAATQVRARIDQILGGRDHYHYFLHTYAFPSLLLPWWLEQGLTGKVDHRFQETLIYSTACGYYAIRIIDNVMDENSAADRAILPLAMVMSNEFTISYSRYFDANHPFWTQQHQLLAQSAGAAISDGAIAIEALDAHWFANYSANKVCAGLIPMTAVALRVQQPALPAEWQALFQQLGRWHQFHNDFFDLLRDHDSQVPTHIQHIYRQTAQPGESLVAWLARYGYHWGVTRLQSELQALRQQANRLSQPLQAYLTMRAEQLAGVEMQTRQAIIALASLLKR